MGEQFSLGADLVIEVVSDQGRPRDLEIKRQEYAQAGIPEYWIVDPQLEQITVLALEGSRLRGSRRVSQGHQGQLEVT